MGCPQGLINVCKALHEHTGYRVRVLGGLSDEWHSLRGLREGCPSSPPLFNVFHDAVMKDYRLRRKRAAEASGQTPGVTWTYQVDGRLHKKAKTRHQSQQEAHPKDLGFRSTVFGDVGFADDTTLAGYAYEMRTGRAAPR